jgi:hypothetical protein
LAAKRWSLARARQPTWIWREAFARTVTRNEPSERVRMPRRSIASAAARRSRVSSRSSAPAIGLPSALISRPRTPTFV